MFSMHNSRIILAVCLDSLLCSMLYGIQQVGIFQKYTHMLQALLDTGKNPRAHNGCYKYHPRVLNPLNACGYQVTFELYHINYNY